MAETIDRNRAFTEGDDPGTYNVTPVQEFLASASREEAERIKAAEADGEGRSGVLDAADARIQELDAPAPGEGEGGPQEGTEDPEPTGLETTGNSMDLSTPYVDPAGSSVSANVGHQEGAPADMVAAVEESERIGYVAPEQNPSKVGKPDYSQRNPQVMNQGSEG